VYYLLHETSNMSENLRPQSIIGPLNVYSILALAGVIGPLVLIVADLTAAISQPGYSPIRDSISSLAWSPMGWLQTIGYGIGLLVCFGFGLLLIGAFVAL
jgi:hypothetical protein